MAPPNTQSKNKKWSFLFTAVAATCCGVIITVALFSMAPSRESKLEKTDVKKLHQQAVSRHMAKVQQKLNSEPLRDPQRIYRAKNDSSTNGIYGDDSPYSKPDPSAVYANLVKQAKPYRKEMVKKLRDQADNPEDDDVDHRINHQAIDYIEKNGLYFQ